jgi:aminopeptidase N
VTVKTSNICKRYLLLGITILSSFLAQAQEEESVCKQVSALVDAEARSAARNILSRTARTTASKDIDLHYHRCDWYVNPAVNAIYGSVSAGFTALTALSTVYFDLKANMIVDSVRYHEKVLSAGRSGDSLSIALPASIKTGVYDSLTIYYHGAPKSSGFGSFVLTSHAGVPAMFTLSEPYGAKDWWPCKNSVDDKIDSLDVTVRCPAAYTGVSNGLHTSTATRGDTTITTWKHRYPITSYLVAIAITNYRQFDRSVDLGSRKLPMETFCYPESLTDFQNQTQSTLDALQFFHNLFGPYPFINEKYGHTQFAWGGGEEHQTNSFVKDPGEVLCAHELAHQWFGDKVTCGAFADIWLNEGFATHSASIFTELRHPENTYANRKSEIDRITSDTGGSVYVFDTANVSRIFDYRLTYLKGSHLLYMLRVQLGNEFFWKGVQNYLNDPKLAYKYAKTSDLRQHLESACSCTLDSFFRQWVYGQGYPSYRMEWTQIGKQTVRLRLGQSTSHSSVPFFQLKVPVRFYGAGKDTTLFLDHLSNGQLFIEDIGFVADSAKVDPDLWLISKSNTVRRNDSLEVPDAKVVLFPNPVREEAQLMLTDFPGEYAAVLLYGINGQTLYKELVPLYQGKAFVRLEARNWSSGSYLIMIVDQNGIKQSVPLQHF